MRSQGPTPAVSTRRPALTVLPASPAHVEGAAGEFPDLLQDGWRDGGNRRSFVAVADAGESSFGSGHGQECREENPRGHTADDQNRDSGEHGQDDTPRRPHVLGHCRGHDNAYHPGSRILALETLPESDLPPGVSPADVEDALLSAQITVSDRPLRMKIYAHMQRERDLAIRHSGIAVQVTPPWRYVVGPELREWADDHRTAHDAEVRQIQEHDRESVRDLEAEHYVAQHAAWSPSAPAAVMRELFAEHHDPASEEAYDPQRSVALERGGEIVAAALLWPLEADLDGREVTLLALPYDGPRSREDKELCFAALIASSCDGETLLVDSHLTERTEAAMMREIPGLVGTSEDWMAIVAIPVSEGPGPIPFPRALVPDEAPWVAELLPGVPAPE